MPLDYDFFCFDYQSGERRLVFITHTHLGCPCHVDDVVTNKVVVGGVVSSFPTMSTGPQGDSAIHVFFLTGRRTQSRDTAALL